MKTSLTCMGAIANWMTSNLLCFIRANRGGFIGGDKGDRPPPYKSGEKF